MYFFLKSRQQTFITTFLWVQIALSALGNISVIVCVCEQVRSCVHVSLWMAGSLCGGPSVHLSLSVWLYTCVYLTLNAPVFVVLTFSCVAPLSLQELFCECLHTLLHMPQCIPVWLHVHVCANGCICLWPTHVPVTTAVDVCDLCV